MKCEVVAIGTELLLGQIVDTNSSYIGEQLAMVGIDSHHQTKVGDNHDRMVAVLRQALDRSGILICCGGLGPTQDDITRAAIAEVMGSSWCATRRSSNGSGPCSAAAAGRCRRTTCCRPMSPRVPRSTRRCPVLLPGSSAHAGSGSRRQDIAVTKVQEMKQMLAEGIASGSSASRRLHRRDPTAPCGRGARRSPAWPSNSGTRRSAASTGR